MNHFNRKLEFEIYENNLELDVLIKLWTKINKDLILDQRCVKSPVYIKENSICELRSITYIIHKPKSYNRKTRGYFNRFCVSITITRFR